ncbi:thiolase family protein [Rhodococcus sp. NPDC127528]|uniref:thiolase C-terminal domain-containing protein n=1 Tax=unclassified Rhodococcus (in: high G+C Gram-positive bacteria) TaxID=192944 RepID=UPI0036382F1E
MNTVTVTGVGRASAQAHGPVAAAATALHAAVADAGASGSAVDGLVTCGVPAADVADTLGLELTWRSEESDRFGVGAALSQAVVAVESGRVRNVICVEAAEPASDARRPREMFGPAPRVGGWRRWHAPYGADSPLVATALAARAYIERFGLTRSELAQVALLASRNGGRGTPLGLREYLVASMLADPLCVHDRAVAVGGAAAVVLGHADDMVEPRPVRVGAVGSAYASSPLAEQVPEPSASAVHRAGAALWAGTDLRPDDVDLALLGDEFSILVLLWLEALGFCEVGTAGGFVAGGVRIAREGALPVNPGGGLLGRGHRVGLDLVVEAVEQLRGVAGAAQIADGPEVAVVGLGAPTVAGCVLLLR